MEDPLEDEKSSVVPFPKEDAPSSFDFSSYFGSSAARNPQPPRGRPLIDYETLVWVVFGVWAILTVIDRFTWNVWPRETYRVGRGTAGSDFTGDHYWDLKDGPWSVQLYDAVARISGRYTIISLNLLFFTMCHTTYAWMVESWAARYVVDMRNYKEANRRIHNWNGIGIVVATLVHVWSIIFPSIFHGWKTQVVLGHFEWPLSERGPKGFKDINLATKTMSMQGDDVYRIVLMTIMLGILLPLTVKWLATKWHLGIHLHGLIAVLYFIDIVRRHTHPHSWILNTPFFVWWIMDLAVGRFWRRFNPEIHRVRLSDNYMLLFWNQEKSPSATIGAKFYVKLSEPTLLERAHVFTGFENRCGLELADGRKWTACLVVRIYNKKRSPALGRIDKFSHTIRMAEASYLNLNVWGPFLGGMSEAVRADIYHGSLPVTLVAGGSAAGYLIDAVQQHCDLRSLKPLTILYTARDGALIHWVSEVLAPLIRKVAHLNCTVVLALTDGGINDESVKQFVERKQRDVEGIIGDTDEEASILSSITLEKSKIQIQHGRINFKKEIPTGNIVFYQGSGNMQKVVSSAARERGCVFVSGASYDNDDTTKTNCFLKNMSCLSRGNGKN